MVEANLNYHINKAPAFLRHVLVAYSKVLLEKDIGDITIYFRKFIARKYPEVMELIIKNMTPVQAGIASIELDKALKSVSKSMNDEYFYEIFLSELWLVLLNVSLSNIKI